MPWVKKLTNVSHYQVRPSTAINPLKSVHQKSSRIYLTKYKWGINHDNSLMIGYSLCFMVISQRVPVYAASQVHWLGPVHSPLTHASSHTAAKVGIRSLAVIVIS